MTGPAEAWGELGRALYDMPGTELPELASQLDSLAHSAPGRAGVALHAFAGLVRAEQRHREQEHLRNTAQAARRQEPST
jgi:hypothetical protein